MFEIQLWLGNLFGVASGIGLLAAAPTLVIFIVLLVTGNFTCLCRFFKYTCTIYLICFGYAELIVGGAYHTAKHIGVYVPWTVQTIEDAAGVGGVLPIDEEWQYTVVKFNQRQMNNFIDEIKSTGSWEQRTVNPSALFINNIQVSLSAYPFPNVQKDGFVYSQKNTVQRKNDDWTKIVICFLDLQARTLYMSYDYRQW